MRECLVKKDNPLTILNWVDKEVQISHILESPDNLRVLFDKKEMQELTSDLEKNGLIFPLLLHKTAKNTYEVIDGHRRLRAIKRIGWKSVDCRVIESRLDTDQIRVVMRATDRLKISWSKYDLAKQCCMELRNSVSASIAAANMLMSVPQFRFYASIGELPSWILQMITANNVPYTYTNIVVNFFTTNALCKKTGLSKEDVIKTMIEKWTSKKIKSIVTFNDCVKRVPQLSGDDIKHWLTSNQGLDVLKAMVDVLPDKEKKVESINRSLGQISAKLTHNEWTFEEIQKVQEQLNILVREVKRVSNKTRAREKVDSQK